MPRHTTPKERLDAANRLVHFVWHAAKDEISMSDDTKPAEVERKVEFLVARGYKIVHVDGQKPPKGSDGRCHYDADGSGPYWKGDL